MGPLWSEGMALSVVAAVPADTEGQIGDVVFVAGKSPAPSGAAKLSAITGTGTTHVDGDFVAYEFIDDGTVTVSDHGFLTEALIVGGGGGGATYAGAGGAGGHLEISNAYLPTGTSNVVIGQGGFGPSDTNENGVNGDSSIIASTYYALGGGGGGMRNFGLIGGSGGSAFGNSRLLLGCCGYARTRKCWR